MKLYKDESIDIIYKMQNRDPFFDYLTSKIIPILKQKGSGRVLDLGCGSGRNAIAAAQLGLDAVGIDSNEKVLNVAKSYVHETGVSDRVKFVHGDILKLKPGQFGQFDVCILQEVIEHIPEFQKAIDYAHGALKKGGVLILSTPHDPAQWNMLDEYAEHVRRFRVAEVLDVLSSFDSNQVYTVGFPFHRLIHTAYSRLLRYQKKQHSAATLRKQPIISRLYYSIGSLLLRVDDLFNGFPKGTTIIAMAMK